MQTKTRMKTITDEEKAELASAGRAAAKRAHAFRAVLRSRGAAELVIEAAERAADLLDDASEAILEPTHRIRGMNSDMGDAGDVAKSMASSKAPHATGIDPPLNLLNEQAGMCVLSGSTSAVPIADLLEFLSMMKKTGILWVRAKAETFTLQLEQGVLVHASSSNSPTGARLGDIMVDQGFVDANRLRTMLRGHTRWSGKIGIALEKAGIVTAEHLTQALEIQVKMLFQRLFEVKNSAFSFAERLSNSTENRVKLGITHLLLESARVSDEDKPH